MAYQPDLHSLVVASGDMTLTINDLRKYKTLQTSMTEDCSEEPLSVEIVDNGMSIVCGSQSGKLMMYPWGNIHTCNEAIKGHPDCIDTVAKYDESTLITGCGDGSIRVVKFSPNNIAGVIGQHGSNDSIEKVAIGHDLSVLGSLGQDDMFRLWDIEFIADMKKYPKRGISSDNQISENNASAEEGTRRVRGKKERKRAKKASLHTAPTFFSDM